MKRLLIAIALILPFTALPQSLRIVSGDTLKQGHADYEKDLKGYISIENTTKTDLDVLVKRIDAGYNELTDSNAICWGNCFNPHISTALWSITIPAETINDTSFVTHVYPDQDGVPRKGPITYVFYVEFNETDSVAYTMNFEVTQDFDIKERLAQNSVWVYPNPAINSTQVSYKLDSERENYFTLYSLLGTKVFEKQLSGKNGEFELDVSQFSAGVYYYALKSEGQLIETKKMVVK